MLAIKVASDAYTWKRAENFYIDGQCANPFRDDMVEAVTATFQLYEESWHSYARSL